MNKLKKLYKTTTLTIALTTPLLYSVNAYARPDAPGNFTGQVNGDSVTVQWNSVDNVDGYNVYINNNYITTTSDTQYTTSIGSNDVFDFYVTSFTKDPIEFSRRSDRLTLPESAVPDDLTIPPSVPSNVRGNIDGGSVTLNWDASTDDEAVAGYNVYRDDQYLTTVFDTQYQGSVDAGRTYRFGVVAFDTRVNFSSSSQILTLPNSGQTGQATQAVATDVAPSTPTGLSGNIDNTTVSLNWNASTDDQAVKGYNVYENGSYKSTVLGNQYSGDVQRDTAYSYYVVAFDFDGNFAQRTERLVLPDNQSGQGQQAQFSGVDTEAPGDIQNITASFNVNGSNADIVLNWDVPSDNHRVDGYNVFENTKYVDTVQSPTYRTTVNADGNYSYRIVAFDEARNYSNPAFSENLPNSSNQAPTFENLVDVTRFAGEDINIVIKPVDVDGGVPGLFIGNLPTGMRSVDNLNGTRSLIWRPLQPDVGRHEIMVTAFDSADSSIQTVDTFVLTLELPDDLSTIRNAGPGIDGIRQQIIRAGDTTYMAVKATDANGTTPLLLAQNLPEGANFNIEDPEVPNIKIFQWTARNEDIGINTFDFYAEDSVDPNLTATSQVEINVVDPSQFNRDGERLKTLAERKDILIGYASLLNFSKRADSDLYRAISAEEFNFVTAENSMKWSYINPEPGQFRFDAADDLLRFASANNMKIHGHTLVWYSALPQWVQRSNVAEREGLMNSFIDTMTSRYNKVDIWDVVNEAFEDDGTFRNSVWFEAMGEDHIEKAFRRTRQGAPNAVLIYNDYDISYGGPKTDATFRLMEKLIGNGAPIDGIGFQMHIKADFTDFGQVRDTFNRFANLGLDIYITEMDVAMVDGKNFDDQARVYERIMQICLDQPACKALQVWGVTDRYTWLDDSTTPLLFDESYQPKPAYRAMQRVLGQ